MRVFGFLPVAGRRTVVALGVAGMMMMASTAQAQEPPPTPPPAQEQPAAPAAPDPFKFDGSNPVMLMLQIKSGQETTFEEAFAAIRAGLNASSNPELQAQGRSMNLMRLTADMPAGSARPYVVFLDPPVSTHSYDFTKMLYESGAWKADDLEARKGIDDIYGKLAASVQEQGIWPLAKK